MRSALKQNMSPGPLSLAIFTSAENAQKSSTGESILSQALIQIGHTIRAVSKLEGLRYFEDVEFFTVEAILIDSTFGEKLDDQISLIKDLRQEEDLQDMPIVVLSSGSMTQFHPLMYEAGADAVLPNGTAPQDLILFIKSLLSKRNYYHSILEGSRFTDESEIQILKTYDSLDTPVIVLSSTGGVRWLNSSAGKAFDTHNISEIELIRYCEYLAGVFRPVIEKFPENISSMPVAIESLTGNNDWWQIQIAPFSSAEGKLKGYVLRLNPQIKEKLVKNRATHLAQLEAMALHTGACAHSVLQKTQSGIVVSPYMRIEEMLASAPQQVNLNHVITSLLEYFDPVISPDISIRVNASNSAIVKMSFGDAFQLVGHMLFTSIGFLLSRGEVVITCGDHVPGSGTRLTFSARSSARAKLGSLLDEGSLEEESFYTNPEIGNEDGKLSTRFEKIRQLTGKYRTELLYRAEGEDVLNLRVELPSGVN